MKKQILIIDDSEALRQSIYYILHEHGYSVVEADTEQEGILKLRSEHVDLVIADDHKPYFNSEAFARNMKDEQQFKHLPIISLSSQQDLGELHNPSYLDGQILKPFSSDKLLYEVKRLCG